MITQTDKWLLIGSCAFLVLACLNMLRVCVGILFEHYRGLYKSKRQERNRHSNQPPSKINKPAGLIRKIFGLFPSLYGKLLLRIRNLCKFSDLFHKPVILNAVNLTENRLGNVTRLSARK